MSRMYLYHFLFAANFKKNNLDPRQHFWDLKEGGLLLPKSMREQSFKTCMLKRDPEEDWDYVFLTSRRDLHKIGMEFAIWDRALSTHAEYGFVFEADSLRNHPDVFFRTRDRLARSQLECTTEPFTDQTLTQECEILVFAMLDLDLACSHIIDGVEHVRSSTYHSHQDAHQQAA